MVRAAWPTYFSTAKPNRFPQHRRDAPPSRMEIPTKPGIENMGVPKMFHEAQDSLLLDFWRWAFSDLRMNDVRGVYAEWLVAKLLHLDPPPRDSWDCCDIRTPDGKRIEVKSAAYVQAWNQTKPSRITFGSLRGRTWDPATGYSIERTFNADVYVFCLEIEKDPARWNALDLGQWRFYVLPRSVIEKRCFATIGLGTLARLSTEINASELKSAVSAILHEPG